MALAPHSNADLPYPRNPPYEVRTPHLHGAPPTDDTIFAYNYKNCLPIYTHYIKFVYKIKVALIVINAVFFCIYKVKVALLVINAVFWYTK